MNIDKNTNDYGFLIVLLNVFQLINIKSVSVCVWKLPASRIILKCNSN